jgi:phosphate-selective porin
MGLNWYPVQNVRFQTNYVKVLDVEGGKYADSEPSAIVTRMAVFW